MFNRIALRWIWALVMMVGLKYPPHLVQPWLFPYKVILGALLLHQCLFIVITTRNEYYRLRDRELQRVHDAYELEQEAVLEAQAGAYGD